MRLFLAALIVTAVSVAIGYSLDRPARRPHLPPGVNAVVPPTPRAVELFRQLQHADPPPTPATTQPAADRRE